MAFVATEHIDVSGMREYDISGVLFLVEDITGMAGCAVTAYPERTVAVVTSSARGTIRHRFHRGVVAVVLRLEEIWMTLFAAEHAAVNVMAKHHLANIPGLDRDIAGVTSGTITGDAECLLSVVTGTTGFAPLHRFHTHMVAIVLLLEELRVARITLGAMQTMAEDNLADSLGLYGEFVHHPSYVAHTSNVPHTYRIQN